MSEFVGRTGSLRVYSYPEPRRSSGVAPAFARNFATGPKGSVLTTDGVQIPWNLIDVGPGGPDVPITPITTGIVLISGVVVLTNGSGVSTSANIHVQVNGINLTIPELNGISVADGTIVAIPILAETDPIETPIGVTTPIEIFVLGAGLFVAVGGSALSLQEVSVATG
jgi:hypothetical protein